MRLETDLPPDPAWLARRLAGRPGLAVLRSDARGALGADDAATSFVASDPVETSSARVPPAGVTVPGWAGRPAAPRWVGYLPYEAFRSLERSGWTPKEERAAPWVESPLWYRYDAVVRIEHALGRVVVEGDDPDAVGRTLARIRDGKHAYHPAVWGPLNTGPDASHTAAVGRVLERIAAGDVYQVNLARRFVASFRGDELDFFDRLFERAPSPYGFFLAAGDHHVAGASPELAVHVDERGALRTGPIKGTRLRGTDAVTDAALAAELDRSPKERAELTMAIDLHRNDLGRVARAGSVHVVRSGELRPGKTVWSRVAEVRATLDAGCTPADLVESALPCGSVTGAPKVRAMEIIAETERDRRGLYTGAFGHVGRDGSLVLAVAIRTAVLRGDELEYFAGGGIVWGSDPERETEETWWKVRQLTQSVRAD